VLPRRGSTLDTLLKDIRYATRSLLRAPGVAVIAVIALGLGIGLTTVMFSIVYGAMYRGLPFEGGDRIMSLDRQRPAEGDFGIGVPIHDFRDWEARQQSFEGLAGFTTGTVNVRAGDQPQRYDGGFITANALQVLGVAPMLGRGFDPEEERRGVTTPLLLGYRAWRDHFGSDPSVLGRSATVNGEVGVIVGVMPEGFLFPEAQEVWVPMRQDPLAVPRGQSCCVQTFGKLREGVSLEAALSEFDGITASLAAEFPETNEGVGAMITPFTERYLGQEERSTLLAMLATVILVLFIACSNVANLLLARAAGRAKDVAIRTSLGASRTRVILQLMAEALVLAAGGALLGTGLAWVGIGLFDRAVQPTNPPFWFVFRLDGPILAFVILISVVAAALSGAIPAWRASSSDLNAVLKDESRGTSSLHIGRLSRGLVIAEVAMSVALLVASGLMVKSVVRLKQMELPFPTDVFTARIGTFNARFPDPASRQRFWEDVESRVAALPGVSGASFAAQLPGVGSNNSPVMIQGESYLAEQDVPSAFYTQVTPSFFDVFGITPVQGRLFTTQDVAGAAQVAIVNEDFVREHFPDGAALGRQIRLGGLQSTSAWREIVGVVPNLAMEGVGETDPDPPAGFYIPLAQDDQSFLTLAVRVDGEPLSITQQVREQVSAADADTPIYFVRTLQEGIDEETWFYGVFGTLFAAFGLAALFMASVGLYGVMSFSVSRRVQEMGIRMALGAEAGQVSRLIIGQGMRQIVIGIVLGSGLAVLVARGLRILFLDAKPWDPGTYALVFAVLAATGFLASAIPARRATQVHPVEALRSG
jgi:putative ABC transport system permease protein